VSIGLVWATLARWFDLFALAGMIGGFAVELAVLPQASTELADVRRSVRGLTGAMIALLAGATVAELIVRSATMAGSVAAGIGAVPLVIGRTHFGALWRLRLLGLALIAALSFSSARGLRRLAFVVALGVAFTTAATGHAADWGDFTPTALIDWLHVVAATTWTGGLFCLTLVVLHGQGSANPGLAVAEIAARFSRLAGLCAVTVLATGAVNLWIELAGVSALWTTTYGRVLVAKLACVAGLLGLGAANRYRVLPALARERPAPGEEPSRASESDAAAKMLTRYVTREAILAALVFACTAFLGQIAPPRHQAMDHAMARVRPRIFALERAGAAE
jgi:putative copper export protein